MSAYASGSTRGGKEDNSIAAKLNIGFKAFSLLVGKGIDTRV